MTGIKDKKFSLGSVAKDKFSIGDLVSWNTLSARNRPQEPDYGIISEFSSDLQGGREVLMAVIVPLNRKKSTPPQTVPLVCLKIVSKAVEGLKNGKN